MYQRPKSDESDDELLQQQEEFYKNLAKNIVNPAAKLVKSDRPYARKEPEHDVKQMEAIPNTKRVPEYVMGKIKEKTDTSENRANTASKKSVTNAGFPRAFVRNKTNPSKKGTSLFAQDMAAKKKAVSDIKVENQPEPMVVDNENIPVREVDEKKDLETEKASKSFILSGPESHKIHEENLQVLNSMSPQDILKERQKLLMSIDPKLVEFIASRRQKNKSTSRLPSTTTAPTESNIPARETVDMEDVPVVMDIISHPDAEKWLHFDKWEPEKYAWMKNIDKMISVKPGEPYEARFDFDGWLQPFSMKDLPLTEETRVLYHHGEEPSRPGYTLQELLHLCRSSVLQQRILALNTIANLLALYSTGVYDSILELPIEQIFFVLRIAVDENNIPVLSAAIRALRNIFYYEIDEMCLDCLSHFTGGLEQPILDYAIPEESSLVDKSRMVQDDELNDQQLAESNLIKCLIRTDILIRIKYIFGTLEAPVDIIYNCVGLLIRIVRDTDQVFDTTLEFFNHELINFIINKYLPTDLKLFSSFVPATELKVITSILKLVRLISARDKCFAINIIEKHNILKPLLFYLSIDAPNSDYVKLQTETLLLYATLLHHLIVSTDHLMELQTILLRHLSHHVHKTDISDKSSYNISAHASAVLLVISKYFKYPVMMEPFLHLLEIGTNKWFAQTSMLTSFKCGLLQIISSIIRCWISMKNTSKFNLNVVRNLLKSSSFSLITQNLRLNSNLLCSYKPHETKSALDSVQASVWNTSEHIVPVLQSSSAIPFLGALSALLYSYPDKEILLLFARHPNIQAYFQTIYASNNLKLLTNWFTRLEIEFIVNFISLATTEHIKYFTEQEKYFVYILSLKIIHIFNLQYKQNVGIILQKIIFNKDFIPCENLMQKLDIESTIFSNCFQQMDQIKDYYMTCLGFKNNKIDNELRSPLTYKNKISGFLPSDWFYLPIIVQYVNQTWNTMHLTEDIKIAVVRCLQCVCIFETLIPEISNIMNITDRYCRLSCVFLCDNSLFLETEIYNLLEFCYKSIFTNSNFQNINFDRKIKGLTNFQDFYTSLLEQYQAISYGNVLFGNVILIPLTQKHNVKWKKIVWSEYLGVVQIINVKKEQVMIPVEDFLYPLETDISLLRCYQRALTMGYLKRSPFLTEVVEHHLNEYKKQFKK